MRVLRTSHVNVIIEESHGWMDVYIKLRKEKEILTGEPPKWRATSHSVSSFPHNAIPRPITRIWVD